MAVLSLVAGTVPLAGCFFSSISNKILISGESYKRGGKNEELGRRNEE